MNDKSSRKPKPITGAAAALIAAVIALSVGIIAPWEGRSLDPYRDIVGVWTVCYGSTNAPMRTYTADECGAMLETEVGTYLAGVSQCIAAPVTTNQLAAITSWTYNVGIGAACGSTLIRQLNAGEPAAVWCKQLLRWNRAGGREVRGLSNRRQAEYEVCIQ